MSDEDLSDEDLSDEDLSVILIAFDVDGTLDTSAGPVVWEKVKALEHACWFLNDFTEFPLVVCAIVSPSPSRPKDNTPGFPYGPDRRSNLRDFAAAYPGAKLRLYVSNNGDMAEAAAAGFAYITEQDFARGLA